MRKPTFVHIGAQRCGTSWMHNCLSEHPQVFTPKPKELHYFNGINRKKGDEWYLSHFTPESHHEAWGEATPGYLSARPDDASVPAHMSELMSDCRIICCLRNPVDRAYSQWKRFVGPDQEPSFRRAVEQNINNCLGRGLYAKHLKRWLQYFSRDQILVQIHEEVFGDNKKAVREAYQHIGADPSFTPAWIGKVQNSVVLPTVQRSLRRLGLGELVRTAKSSPLGTLIRRVRHQYVKAWSGTSYQKEMEEEVRQQLVQYFAEPNQELEGLLGRELPGWPT